MMIDRVEANHWYHRTVQQLFRETCAQRGDRAALVYRDRQISFAELQDRVDTLTWALIKLEVGPGDVVATLPTATPDFTCLYFAVLQAGARINPLNLLWGEIELAGILPRNDPKMIVTVGESQGRDYIRTLGSALPDLEFGSDGVRSAAVPALRHLVSVGASGGSKAGILDFAALMAMGEGYDRDAIEARVAASHCTDIQFICQTSGSTGLSKSALWNHRAPLSTVHFVSRALLVNDDDSFLNMAPYYHNSGVVGAMTLNLAYTGTTLHLMETFNPDTAFEIMAKYRPTLSFGFDAHWQALRMAQAKSGGTFTLRKVMAAIAPNTYDMLKTELMGGEGLIASLYAQTENGPMVSLMEPDCVDEDLRRNTQGRPIGGVRVVVKDIETGEPVRPGAQGEICYRSPFLFQGYYKQEEATRQGFDADGYFHSGDFGTFEDGYIRFFGRLGGVVKSGGENVSTAYVNSLVLEIFAADFDDAQTIALPDPYWGAKLVTWVRLKEGRALCAMEDFKAAAKGRMANYEIPKAVLQWQGPWPVNQIGKLQMAVLEKRAKALLAAD